jgi:phosphoglycolate phosphatase
MPARAVVFDLDGTLIDSRRDLTTAVNRVRTSYGLAPLPLDRVMAMVGEGARLLVARTLGLAKPAAPGAGDPPPSAPGPEGPPDGPDGIDLDQALRRFYGEYEQVLLDTTRPYPEVVEMLAAVAERLPAALLTNKPERFARRLADALGLAPYLAEIAGGDTFASRKPDPEGLLELARRLGAAPAATVLVGDSRVDAATAEAAGCRFALVTWGLPTAGERSALRRRYRPAVVAEDAGALARGLLDGPAAAVR